MKTSIAHYILNVAYKHCILCFVLVWSIFLDSNAQTNTEINIKYKTTHVDYLPKYRQRNFQILLSKVEYYKTETAIHIRYIINKKGKVYLHGKNTDEAYTASVPVYGLRSSAQPVKRPADILNVRLNDNLEMLWVPETDAMAFDVDRGDILSFELHFDNFPSFVRTLNIGGGDADFNASNSYLITDLLLKSKTNRSLGTPEQMERVVTNFYAEHSYIKYATIKDISPANKVAVKIQKEQASTPIMESMKPVKSMPNMLNSVVDLECKQRLILKNVYFNENSAVISRRLQAMKTLNIVYKYMKQDPESKIVLHGHTDIFGDAYNNLVLSKNRVIVVKRILVQKGIQSSRIITLYHGGTAPLPNYSDGHSMNRRVEVELVCNEAKNNTVVEPREVADFK